MSGPVSSALEEDVRTLLRQRGAVVWLDKDAHYSAFIDQLAARFAVGEFPHPVVAFRGSFLELMFALEPYGSGLDNAPLLIHLPGFNETTVRATPLLELYECGQRHRVALDAFIRRVAAGRIAPEEVEQFLTEPGLTLERADQWTRECLSGVRDALAGQLEVRGHDALVGDLLAGGTFLTERVRTSAGREVLLGHLERVTGMTVDWTRFVLQGRTPTDLDEIALAFGAWLLSIEYVHDLTRPPHLATLQPLRDLSSPVVGLCKAMVEQLRERHPDRYERMADEVETLLLKELESILPADLGKIDTFRIEEAKVLTAAIQTLRAGDWQQALAWVEVRDGDDARRVHRSFWIEREKPRRWAWTLVGEMARLGQGIAAADRPLRGARGLEHALDLYTERAAPIDRAHRRFEQRRLALLDPQVPHFGDLQEIVGQLRARYRRWADDLARDFTTLCRDHGPLPDEALQQRTLFDQVVHPLAASGERVALLTIDALRFEMAAELLDGLKSPGTTASLKARYAELPTLTAVGMNALAPVATHGRLTPALDRGGAILGFRAGEFTVNTPETRARAMGIRSGGGTSALRLSLDAVRDADEATLKRQVAQAKLIVVQSTEIDDAGEAGLGLQTFERALRDIESVCRRLQSAGVRHIVLTADHGFLLQDETTQVQPYGKATDPDRRHIYAAEARAEAGLMPVSMAALGYEGVAGYLLFREDTAVFATRTAGASFVHGGNSLQERVIPVLTLSRKREAGGSSSSYVVEAERQKDLLGMQCVRVRVVLAPHSSGELAFASAGAVDLALRVPERPKVRITLKDVQGPAVLGSSRVRTRVDPEWAYLYFALEGERDERVSLEVFHPDATERVAPRLVEGFFEVSGIRPPSVPPPSATSRATPANPASQVWADALGDEGVRKVFLHLWAYGSLSETELGEMLGSSRAARKFALAFDTVVQQVPFRVRIETTPAGKRYVKETEKEIADAAHPSRR